MADISLRTCVWDGQKAADETDSLLGMGLLPGHTVSTMFFQLCCSLENDPFEIHLWLLKDNKISVIDVLQVSKHLAIQ